MSAHVERMLDAVLRELWDKRAVWLILSIVVSVVFMVIGISLPKVYSTYASILTVNRNIAGPLMEGAAEQTDGRDMAAIVREVAFSRRLLEQILEVGGWLESNPSPIQRERMMEELIDSTDISNFGKNLIGIRYEDILPERAFLVTKMYLDYVLQESRSSMRAESLEAFEFIDAQVDQYHNKILVAEEALKQFRLANMETLPETAADVNRRGSTIRSEIESLELELNGLAVTKRSIQKQLSGEAEVTNTLSRESVVGARILELQLQLDNLRLSYHDTYPDIIRIKSQIDDLRASLESPGTGFSGFQVSSDDSRDGTSVNPLFDQLRSELAAAETRHDTVVARISELSKIFDREVQRGRKIAETEVQLAELSREYQVNRDIHEDLLRRRERARMSMSLDANDQGLTMRIQEPPVIPRTPNGLRFLHVMIGAIVTCLAIPIMVSAALVQVDPRIRTKYVLEDQGIPVIATIPKAVKVNPGGNLLNMGGYVLGFLFLITLYAVVAWLKLSGRL